MTSSNRPCIGNKSTTRRGSTEHECENTGKSKSPNSFQEWQTWYWRIETHHCPNWKDTVKSRASEEIPRGSHQRSGSRNEISATQGFPKGWGRGGLRSLNEVCEVNPSKKEMSTISGDVRVTFVPVNALNSGCPLVQLQALSLLIPFLRIDGQGILSHAKIAWKRVA